MKANPILLACESANSPLPSPPIPTHRILVVEAEPELRQLATEPMATRATRITPVLQEILDQDLDYSHWGLNE